MCARGEVVQHISLQNLHFSAVRIRPRTQIWPYSLMEECMHIWWKTYSKNAPMRGGGSRSIRDRAAMREYINGR